MKLCSIEVAKSIGYVVLVVREPKKFGVYTHRLNVAYTPEQIDSLVADMLAAKQEVIDDMARGYAQELAG